MSEPGHDGVPDIYAVSDLHVAYPESREQVRGLRPPPTATG
jgi:hypothetical protein